MKVSTIFHTLFEDMNLNTFTRFEECISSMGTRFKECIPSIGTRVPKEGRLSKALEGGQSDGGGH